MFVIAFDGAEDDVLFEESGSHTITKAMMTVIDSDEHFMVFCDQQNLPTELPFC